jgi:hypothetical protein
LSGDARLVYRRRMTRSSAPFALALATLALPSTLALAGCGGGDPLSRIESTYDRMVNDLCSRCPAATGSSTEAECRAAGAANNPFSGAQWDCQRGVYQRFPNELGPQLRLHLAHRDVLRVVHAQRDRELPADVREHHGLQRSAQRRHPGVPAARLDHGDDRALGLLRGLTPFTRTSGRNASAHAAGVARLAGDAGAS